MSHDVVIIGSYNSLENPIGIETDITAYYVCQSERCYNSLENPIGIETM